MEHKNEEQKRRLVNILSMITVVLSSIIVIYVFSSLVGSCMESSSEDSFDFDTNTSSILSDSVNNTSMNSMTSPNSYTITRHVIITPQSFTR